MTSPNTNYLQITFVHRPAELGVTYHVQASTNMAVWSDIATYSGSNAVLTAQAMQVTNFGFPNESVTVRDVSGVNCRPARYLRVAVTRP